jgi:hypothetical protein
VRLAKHRHRHGEEKHDEQQKAQRETWAMDHQYNTGSINFSGRS